MAAAFSTLVRSSIGSNLPVGGDKRGEQRKQEIVVYRLHTTCGFLIPQSGKSAFNSQPDHRLAR
jgi:hypothetical protein